MHKNSKSGKRNQTKTKIFYFGLILVIFGYLGLNVFTNRGSDQPSESSSGTLPKVTIGIQVSPAMTLVMVAKDRRLFEKNGLNVEIKKFSAGKDALMAFLGGGIDFAVSGEVPVALATLQGSEIRVVTQVVQKTKREVRMIALKDGEITDPRKYFKKKRRKLATSFGGGPEFFTYRFLKHYGIDQETIEIVSQKPEHMPGALGSGSVDVISIFDPFAYIAETQSGAEVMTFPDPELYSEFYVLNARPEQIEKDKDIITRLVRGLDEAAKFIEENPESSKDVLQRYNNLDRKIIDGIWEHFIFKPALVPQLLTYWEAQADWAMETGKVKFRKKKPAFEEILVPGFLKEVRPSAVKFQQNGLPYS